MKDFIMVNQSGRIRAIPNPNHPRNKVLSANKERTLAQMSKPELIALIKGLSEISGIEIK